MLGKTPSEIGELRRERPMDIRFLEKKILSNWKRINEENEKMKRDSQRASRQSRIGR